MVNFDDFRTVFEVTPVDHRFQPCFSHRFARFAGLPERHDTSVQNGNMWKLTLTRKLSMEASQT